MKEPIVTRGNFEAQRREILTVQAHAGCPEIIDIHEDTTAKSVSGFVVTNAGTADESVVFKCPGRHNSACAVCQLLS
jgi:hypothetical protein